MKRKTASRYEYMLEPDWSDSPRIYRVWMLRALMTQIPQLARYAAGRAYHTSPYWSPVRAILEAFK